MYAEGGKDIETKKLEHPKRKESTLANTYHRLQSCQPCKLHAPQPVNRKQCTFCAHGLNHQCLLVEKII